VAQRPVRQLPDEPLAVGHRALPVVLVQLVHHDTQAVDETSGRNLKADQRHFKKRQKSQRFMI
jgi:hypothetical protein